MGNKSLIVDRARYRPSGGDAGLWILEYTVSRTRSRGKARLNEREKEGENCIEGAARRAAVFRARLSRY